MSRLFGWIGAEEVVKGQFSTSPQVIHKVDQGWRRPGQKRYLLEEKRCNIGG